MPIFSRGTLKIKKPMYFLYINRWQFVTYDEVQMTEGYR